MVISAKQRQKGRVDFIFLACQRIVALLLIGLAIQYWMRLIGIFEGPQFRFDTMPEHWRFAASALAVLLPATALGLWGGSTWGTVLWLVVIALELAMHTWFADLFGRADLRVIFHIASLVMLLGFAAAMRFLANKE